MAKGQGAGRGLAEGCGGGGRHSQCQLKAAWQQRTACKRVVCVC